LLSYMIHINTLMESSSKIIKIVTRKTWKFWIQFLIQFCVLFWMIAFGIITPDAKTKLILHIIILSYYHIIIRSSISKSRFWSFCDGSKNNIDSYFRRFSDSVIRRFDDLTIRQFEDFAGSSDFSKHP
jgi:hypothetical protein